jgi:hypothetical protein
MRTAADRLVPNARRPGVRGPDAAQLWSSRRRAGPRDLARCGAPRSHRHALPTIEAGKVANLLLLRANPLETVEAYDAIDLVIVRGRVIDRSVLAVR